MLYLSTHTSVRIAKDAMEPRMPRLNVQTNQILAHTFSHGPLDSVAKLVARKISSREEELSLVLGVQEILN